MSDLSIPRDESFWINNSGEVLSQLKNMYQQNSLITLFYKGIFCLSTIIDYDRNHIWLDISSNEKEGDFLIKQPEIYLKCQIFNIPIFMELKGGKLVEMENGLAWQFNTPERIHKQQRRESFRVHFPISLPTIIKLGESKTHMYIYDLSLTGLGMISNDNPNVNIGDVVRFYLEVAAFKNLPSAKMEMQAIIRYMAPTNNEKHRIGLEFYQLSRSHEAYLSKLQMQLQLIMANR